MGSTGAGRLRVKVKLGDDQRALDLDDDLAYADIPLMVQRLFPKKISQSDDLLFKYLDEGRPSD